MVTACEKLMARLIVNVPVQDIEADEIWSFIQKKQKAVNEDDDSNYGDTYCFVAIERNTKLVVNFALGKRNQATTDIFIEGLPTRPHARIFKSPRTVCVPTFRPSKTRSLIAPASASSLRSTALRLKANASTRRSGEHGGGPSPR
jgi:hypothetical protein